MLAMLKRTWFGPDGVRYRDKDRSGSAFIQTFPDDFLSQLPSDAKVFDEKRELVGTAEEVRTGAVKAKAAVDPAEVKKAKALEEAKAAVDAAQAAVTKESNAANVKTLNEAKAALAKLETPKE